ncbi:CrcB family protein [Eubacteriaceae bacterium ES3]|nr:CrcB family protein [Eubacteriaceae bacterium ES3]
MKKYYIIGAGGAIGALLRFQIKNIPTLFNSPDQLVNVSLNILLINLIGSFLLGILNALFSKTDRISDDLKLGLTTGLIGAFTTFSTFCKQSILILDADYITFFGIYLTASIFLGVLFVYIGHLLGTYVLHPYFNGLQARSELEQS